MDKEKFYNYIRDNFEPDGGTAMRLIWNILSCVEEWCSCEDEQRDMLCELLDGTIGLTEEDFGEMEVD